MRPLPKISGSPSQWQARKERKGEKENKAFEHRCHVISLCWQIRRELRAEVRAERKQRKS